MHPRKTNKASGCGEYFRNTELNAFHSRAKQAGPQDDSDDEEIRTPLSKKKMPPIDQLCLAVADSLTSKTKEGSSVDKTVQDNKSPFINFADLHTPEDVLMGNGPAG